MNEGPPVVIIGYGSIGKRHARTLASLGASLAIVNRGDAVRAKAKKDYPSARVVGRLEELDTAGFQWRSAAAVIATWAPSHADLFHALADRGVRRILCEKPMAASVAQASGVARRAEREGIWLGLNHTLRYARFAPALRRLAKKHELGEPVLVVVEGGAACLSTNGVHWIDFVSELFKTDPVRVVSTVRGDPINPRSKDLFIYGGTAVWSFSGDRDAMISFNNKSSLKPRARVQFHNGLAEVGFVATDSDEFLSGTLRWCGADVLGGSPAVTNTDIVTGSLHECVLPGIRGFNEGLTVAARELLDSRVPTCGAAVGVTSVSSVIGALVATRAGRAISLPIDADETEGQEIWPIT